MTPYDVQQFHKIYTGLEEDFKKVAGSMGWIPPPLKVEIPPSVEEVPEEIPELKEVPPEEVPEIGPWTLREARIKFYLAHPGRVETPPTEELKPYLAE